MPGSLLVHERQVIAHLCHTALVGDRPMPGHHHIDVHTQHQVAGRHPVGERAGPHDGRTADEQNVAGEHGGCVGHVGDGVASGVGRADLDQLDETTTHLDVETVVESARRRCEFDAGEVERSEERPEQFTHFPGCIVERRHHGCGYLVHLCRCCARSDDLGLGDELVAVAVVAVGVCVEQCADGCTCRERRQGVEHALCECEVEQCVDEQ